MHCRRPQIAAGRCKAPNGCPARSHTVSPVIDVDQGTHRTGMVPASNVDRPDVRQGGSQLSQAAINGRPGGAHSTCSSAEAAGPQTTQHPLQQCSGPPWQSTLASHEAAACSSTAIAGYQPPLTLSKSSGSLSRAKFSSARGRRRQLGGKSRVQVRLHRDGEDLATGLDLPRLSCDFDYFLVAFTRPWALALCWHFNAGGHFGERVDG